MCGVGGGRVWMQMMMMMKKVGLIKSGGIKLKEKHYTCNILNSDVNLLFPPT